MFSVCFSGKNSEMAWLLGVNDRWRLEGARSLRLVLLSLPKGFEGKEVEKHLLDALVPMGAACLEVVQVAMRRHWEAPWPMS